METIRVKDKDFVISIPTEDILKEVHKLAARMNEDLKGQNPLFLAVLNGSFMFAADLLKKIDIDCGISFIKLASYQGTSSTGDVRTLVGLDGDINGRTIVIIEDIVDTGNTIVALIQQLQSFNPKEIKIATLLFKPEAYTKDIKIDYVALEVPNDFLVGYGLDYDGLGRNLESIYTLADND
ncbi:MAG: hypoxanthine phosphoribosyltransferase [Flavobacteriales bacterium]|nr:hypoxanthine phosphoribosyltransferase [Flavobacteriales bacterium]